MLKTILNYNNLKLIVNSIRNPRRNFSNSVVNFLKFTYIYRLTTLRIFLAIMSCCSLYLGFSEEMQYSSYYLETILELENKTTNTR